MATSDRVFARQLAQAGELLAQLPHERTPHPTVQLAGHAIDEAIAPLVELVWEAGIRTTSSCQGDVLLAEIAARYFSKLSISSFSAMLTVRTHEEAELLTHVLAEADPVTSSATPTYAGSLVEYHSFGNGYYHVLFPPRFLTSGEWLAAVEVGLHQAQQER